MRSSMGPSKLFVGEIGDNRKSDISRLFSKYGEISTIYVDDNKHFAFVEFTSSSDAQHALKHTHNKTVNGAKLRVEYAKPDRPPRDNNRRGLSREHTPTAALYNRLQVTANRLPTMPTIRQNYYQHHPSNTMVNSAMSRGRSLTPPSLKQHPRLSSMNHLQAQDFYPSYYPPHPAMYADSAYYRTYGDPYLMQRLPPPPPPDFLPTTSSSSRAYRHMYSSSDLDRYPPVMSHRRTQPSRSRSRRRRSTSRKNRFSRERKRKRRTPSSSSPQQQRERGPQTPPPPPPPSQPQSSSSNRSKKRERSESDTVASVSEQKSSSSSVSDDEGGEDKQSHSKRSPDDDSDRKHSKRRMKK